MQQDIAQTGLDNSYAKYASEQDALARQLGLSTDLMNFARAVPGVSTSGTGTSNTSGTQTTRSSGGLMENLQSAAKIAATIYAMSDRRVKTDLVPEGGGWWTFRYLWDRPGTRRRGVIAQEVMEWKPEAVMDGPGGFLMVNYAGLEI